MRVRATRLRPTREWASAGALPPPSPVRAERGDRLCVITDVARQLGVGAESLRNWVRRAEIDGGSIDECR
jgi:hypothetical protein